MLAPKAWVSRDVNTLISFSSASPFQQTVREAVPLEITVLSPSGETVGALSHVKKANSCWILDIRDLVRDKDLLADSPSFFTVTARGGAGMYAIMTFVINDATGSFALEHSLPPHYYMNGNARRVRREAAQLSVRK
jgi:hypothetical protein